MLVVSLKESEYLTIGDRVTVQVKRVSGERAVLNIDAPKDVHILRGRPREKDGKPLPDCLQPNSK